MLWSLGLLADLSIYGMMYASQYSQYSFTYQSGFVLKETHTQNAVKWNASEVSDICVTVFFFLAFRLLTNVRTQRVYYEGFDVKASVCV